MSVTVNILNKDGTTETVQALCPIAVAEQLGVELDGGTMRFIRTESHSQGVVAPLSDFSVSVDTSDENETFSFIGTDSRSLLVNNGMSGGIYKHSVNFVEASKLLQGIMIDGFAVTQPDDIAQRDSLYDVLQRLLIVAPFDYAQSTTPKFQITQDTTVILVLNNTVAPQFKWNTQTSLWECLVQIGAVIDAIPRLIRATNGQFIVVTFSFVNVYATEANAIYDGATNVVGENVEEGQYNTALSAIVENLMEE